ncbi:proteasome assembly chaperone family protein [Methanocaldococcus indicus]|uniref:proteasome assembly chaperone family protein n=1 Tax=Methanocaldococcus indicus TaxID=213231 RepID=UPI003C6CE2BD
MVKIITRKIKDVEKLENALLIEELPGIGHVGRLAAEHLVHEFNGEKFLELFCYDFPPQVLVKDDGTIEYMCASFYRIEEPKPMIIVVGNTQALSPIGQYHLSEEIVKIGIEYGANFVYTFGGFGTGKISEEIKVYGATTKKELAEKIKEYGIVFRTDGGGIVGAAGLMLLFADLNNIPGICLMGETPGYFIDPNAAKAVLEKFGKIENIEINLEELEKRAKGMEEFFDKIRKFEEEMIKNLQQQKKPAHDDDLRYIG